MSPGEAAALDGGLPGLLHLRELLIEVRDGLDPVALHLARPKAAIRRSCAEIVQCDPRQDIHPSYLFERPSRPRTPGSMMKERYKGVYSASHSTVLIDPGDARLCENWKIKIEKTFQTFAQHGLSAATCRIRFSILRLWASIFASSAFGRNFTSRNQGTRLLRPILKSSFGFLG